MGTSIPKGWLGCPKVGEGIVDGKFLCFKTPLSKKYDHKLSSDDIWNPNHVIDYATDKFEVNTLYYVLLIIMYYVYSVHNKNNNLKYVKSVPNQHKS